MEPVVILQRMQTCITDGKGTARSRRRKCRRALFDKRKFYYKKEGAPKPGSFSGWGQMKEVRTMESLPPLADLDLTSAEEELGIQYFRGFDYWESLADRSASPFEEGEEIVRKRTRVTSICPDNSDIFSFTIQPTAKRAIRVLALCDGIATGLYTLKALGIRVGTYFSSEIDEDCLKVQRSRFPGEIVALGCMERVSQKHFLKSLGRIDLLLCSPPCSDLSMVNANRKEFDDPSSTAFLTIAAARVRDYLAERMYQEGVPFFWLCEQTAHMSVPCRRRLTEAMRCEPQVLCSSACVPMFRKRLYYGNVPGMKSLEVGLAGRVTDKTLQDYLDPQRTATVKFASTLTSNACNQGFPVLERGTPSRLTTTEAESLLGFSRNFTACSNLSQQRRLNLLGRSWCVKVIANILRPLAEMYACVKRSE